MRRFDASVNFVRRDVNESRDFMPARRFEQRECAVEICLDYGRRRVYAAVDVRLGCEVNYRVGRFLAENVLHRILIAYVCLHKRIATILEYGLKVLEIPGVGQLIDIDAPIPPRLPAMPFARNRIR